MSESLEERRDKLMSIKEGAEKLSEADIAAKEAIDLYATYSKLAKSLFEGNRCKLDNNPTSVNVVEAIGKMEASKKEYVASINPDIVDVNGSLVQSAEKSVSGMGLGKIDVMGVGTSAIAFSTEQGDVLRVAPSENSVIGGASGNRYKNDMTVQPKQTIDDGIVKIEQVERMIGLNDIVKLANNGQENPDHLSKLTELMILNVPDGYYVADPQPENLGFCKDGMMRSMDPDVIPSKSDLEKEAQAKGEEKGYDQDKIAKILSKKFMKLDMLKDSCSLANAEGLSPEMKTSLKNAIPFAEKKVSNNQLANAINKIAGNQR